MLRLRNKKLKAEQKKIRENCKIKLRVGKIEEEKKLKTKNSINNLHGCA